ncbi:spore germination protein [Paenibacillus marchantiophytorum]|uniref:Spore germination protein n=1 Tax=Paenibacillus marchantiophytorum TaxID=1619310 RepID=A0ABQ2BRE6_9BACL|nr:spore germination protein [Paenibacillus marchantiophytorum]GGI44335.1 spore germination protein [Paenibacillus marchantiophytorum]
MRYSSWFFRKKYRTLPQAKAQKQAHNDFIDASLAQNLIVLRSIFTHTPDLIVREFTIKHTGEPAALVYLMGLVDKSSINNNVLKPLQFDTDITDTDGSFRLSIGQILRLNTWPHVENAILQGRSLLFVNGRLETFALDTQGWPQRAIEDPAIEASLKGAHQGFVETGTQNIALIRRYISNRELKMKELTVGLRANSAVSLLYLADVANPEVLQEFEDRIARLNVDTVINTGELAEYIEDNPYSPFPQFILTERPDAAASQILQGRIVAVLDRSPSVLVGPVTFTSFFQSVDDYSTRWSIATFIRLLRVFAFFIATFLPAFYIAVISYHFEIIPIKLLLTIGEFRGRVPFPPFVEAVIMEITLEMMREAGVRLPAPVGQTVGIVGGIVIGQAIVQAGLINNIMVIVVAFTAIASFILPNYDMVAAIRLIRFAMMIAAAMFGFVGIIIGMMTMIGHLISLESLGTPYTTPFAPMRFADWKDTFIRMPVWKMRKRPLSARPIQSTRQGDNHPEGDGK